MRETDCVSWVYWELENQSGRHASGVKREQGRGVGQSFWQRFAPVSNWELGRRGRARKSAGKRGWARRGVSKWKTEPARRPRSLGDDFAAVADMEDVSTIGCVFLLLLVCFSWGGCISMFCPMIVIVILVSVGGGGVRSVIDIVFDVLIDDDDDD